MREIPRSAQYPGAAAKAALTSRTTPISHAEIAALKDAGATILVPLEAALDDRKGPA